MGTPQVSPGEEQLSFGRGGTEAAEATPRAGPRPSAVGLVPAQGSNTPPFPARPDTQRSATWADDKSQGFRPSTHSSLQAGVLF